MADRRVSQITATRRDQARRRLNLQLPMVTSPRYIQLYSLDLVPETPHMGSECPNVQSPTTVHRLSREGDYRHQLAR
jgi:hypothetical protein